MVVDVVGRRAVEFKSKETGENVSYVELHVVSKDARTEGLAVQVINTGLEKARSIAVPHRYELSYEPTRAGKARLVDLVPVEA